MLYYNSNLHVILKSKLYFSQCQAFFCDFFLLSWKS